MCCEQFFECFDMFVILVTRILYGVSGVAREALRPDFGCAITDDDTSHVFLFDAEYAVLRDDHAIDFCVGRIVARFKDEIVELNIASREV